jgi:hypothetical protein
MRDEIAVNADLVMTRSDRSGKKTTGRGVSDEDQDAATDGDVQGFAAPSIGYADGFEEASVVVTPRKSAARLAENSPPGTRTFQGLISRLTPARKSYGRGVPPDGGLTTIQSPSMTSQRFAAARGSNLRRSAVDRILTAATTGDGSRLLDADEGDIRDRIDKPTDQRQGKIDREQRIKTGRFRRSISNQA